MELVVGHELISEECLISNDSLRNTVVLFIPLSKGVQRLRRFQTSEGRSPQEVSGTINYDEGEIRLRAKFDFLVIDKNQITKGRCPKSCDSGSWRSWNGGATNTTGPEDFVVFVVDLSWQSKHAGRSTKLSGTHVVMLHMQLVQLNLVVQFFPTSACTEERPLTPHVQAMEARSS